jgi:Uma2 family endonuclease
MDSARRLPTIADLEALPPHVKGEIIEGVLYTMTRPRARHQLVATVVGSRLYDPFGAGRGGPGGWWILIEPGIELPTTPEIAPDLAGWRRERLVELPEDSSITVVPDWVCEILSPGTRRHDLLVKKPYYARLGVPFHWLIDREARTLTAYRLEAEHWIDLGTWGDEPAARIPPFDAVAMDVSSLWG